MIKVRIKNEEITLYQTGSIKDLVDRLQVKDVCSLIRVNNLIIKPEKYGSIRLRDGDYIDIAINYARCKTLRQE